MEVLPGWRVRAVDLNVTDHAARADQAVRAGGVLQGEPVVDRRWMTRRHVTPLAEEGHFRYQQALVVRSVRVVTRHARVCHRRVLPQIWTALLRVAAGARFVHRRPDLEQLDVGGPVRVVAGGAHHLAFAHGHVIEAIQPVDDVAVAGPAELGLGCRRDLLVAFRAVDAVAGNAPDVALLVLAAGPQGVRSAHMAARANLGCLARRESALGEAAELNVGVERALRGPRNIHPPHRGGGRRLAERPLHGLAGKHGAQALSVARAVLPANRPERRAVVEDEPDLCQSLAQALREEQYAVDTAADGEDGIFKAESWDYDAIVLDIMLPRLNGWEVLQRLRRTKKTPVLLLTARDTRDDRIRGLDTGADDYVVKPFSPQELVSRVRAVLRRGQSVAQESGERPLTFGDLLIDPQTRLVTVQGKEVLLTAREFDMLWLLARHPRQVFTRRQLLERVWGLSDYIDPGTVTVHIRRLREKIEADASKPARLLTVWGVGYKFEIEE